MAQVVTGLGGLLAYGETALERSDDGAFQLDVSAVFENGFRIGGVTYPSNSLFVSTDGLVSFGAAVVGVQSSLSAMNLPSIAVFHGDVDTRLDGEGDESGTVWVDIDPVSDIVTITWASVGYYRRNASSTNTFQIQLADQGAGNFDVALRYEQVKWVTGDLQGGSKGLYGNAALAGLRLSTSGEPVMLAASGNETALLTLPQTPGNTGVAGLYQYEVRGGSLPPSITGDNGAGNGSGGGNTPPISGRDIPPGSGGNTPAANLGDDRLDGVTQSGLLDGGPGFDLADYTTATTGFVADLATHSANTGAAAGDSYQQIEGLVGGTGADDLRGDGGGNALYGGAGSDRLWGRDRNDTLVGGDGDDTISGGHGADQIDGGTGSDIASYEDATIAVQVDLVNSAVNTGDAVGDVFLGIEGLWGGNFNDTLAGDGAANYIIGGAGNDSISGRSGLDLLAGADGDDTLDGGLDNDTLNGGAGLDLVSYATATSAIKMDLAAPSSATGDAAGDSLIAIEGVIGSAFSDMLIGDIGLNWLAGEAGQDSLAGRDGADSLYGGTGNDILDGGTGNDILDGGAGSDSLNGGAGTDLASYAGAGTAILADLEAPKTNTSDARGDKYIGIEGLLGGAFNDTLRGGKVTDYLHGADGHDYLLGNNGNDALFGGTGSDTLIGGAGSDHNDGGDGIDWVVYTKAVKLDLRKPSASTGEAKGDVFINIEGVSGSKSKDMLIAGASPMIFYGGAGNDSLGGGAGNDDLYGGLGDDMLVGGGGDDTLNGGAGTDRLDGRDGFDKVVFTTTVTLDLMSPKLSKGDAKGDVLIGIEEIIGSPDKDILLGSALGDNMSGEGSNDTLMGRAGNDSLGGEAGNDTVDGGSGNDTLLGGNGDDLLLGQADEDKIWANPGNDTLNGGANNDKLAGGLGADLFLHTGAMSDGTDHIIDYSAAESDAMLFTGAGGTYDQFAIETASIAGAGANAIADLRVIYKPTGQALWLIEDGTAMSDLYLQIGTTRYDLI